MLKTSRMLTITVPKVIYQKIRREAKKQQTTISGLLRDAFAEYTNYPVDIYTDAALAEILEADKLPLEKQRALDRRLKRKYV